MMRKLRGNNTNITAVIRFPQGRLPPFATGIVSSGDPVANEVITNICMRTEARKKYLIRLLFILNFNLKTMNKANTLLLAFLLVSLPSVAQKRMPKIPSITHKDYWAHIPKSETTDEFYLGRFEITNGAYSEFLADLDENSRKNHEPKLEGWNSSISGASIPNGYLGNPQLKDYPVVGVNWVDAEAFAQWLTSVYNNSPKRDFKKVKFRLPTEAEWVVAAKGGRDMAKFPWGGPYLANRNGQVNANVLRFSDTNVISDLNKDGKIEFVLAESSQVKDPTLTIPSPVNSFMESPPHMTFNMSGNVAEITTTPFIEGNSSITAKGGSFMQTAYWATIEAREEFSEPNPYTGFRLVMVVIEK